MTTILFKWDETSLSIDYYSRLSIPITQFILVFSSCCKQQKSM